MENDKEPKSILDRLNRRFYSEDVKSFTFKHQYKPGLVSYFTIDIGKKYKINSNTKKINGFIVEVLAFIYNQGQNPINSTPIGVRVKFLRNNNTGSYYDLYELNEVLEES